MSIHKTAALCANCSANLYEGQPATYDDYRDQHFCGGACFSEWWAENTEVLAEEYRRLNLGQIDL